MREFTSKFMVAVLITVGQGALAAPYSGITNWTGRGPAILPYPSGNQMFAYGGSQYSNAPYLLPPRQGGNYSSPYRLSQAPLRLPYGQSLMGMGYRPPIMGGGTGFSSGFGSLFGSLLGAIFGGGGSGGGWLNSLFGGSMFGAPSFNSPPAPSRPTFSPPPVQAQPEMNTEAEARCIECERSARQRPSAQQLPVHEISDQLNCGESQKDRDACEMIAGVNEIRRRKGLRALGYDRTCATAAEAHGRDMASRGYFSHDSPEGGEFQGRYSQAKARVGGQLSVASENIFMGSGGHEWNAREANAELEASPGHYANMISASTTHMGIARTKGRCPGGGSGCVYYVQCFSQKGGGSRGLFEYFGS